MDITRVKIIKGEFRWYRDKVGYIYEVIPSAFSENYWKLLRDDRTILKAHCVVLLETINPFKKGSQKHRLLERLQVAPVRNSEIIRDLGIFNYTGRISDLRKKGFDIRGRSLEGGLWEYRLM